MCNHPDLFEGRSIVSSFDMWPLQQRYPSLALHVLSPRPWAGVALGGQRLRLVPHPDDLSLWEADAVQVLTMPCLGFRVCGRPAPHLDDLSL